MPASVETGRAAALREIVAKYPQGISTPEICDQAGAVGYLDRETVRLALCQMERCGILEKRKTTPDSGPWQGRIVNVWKLIRKPRAHNRKR